MIKRIIICIICVFSILVSLFSFRVAAFTFSDGDFGFELDTFEKTSALVEYTGNAQIVNVPTGYSSYNLTAVKKSAFSGNSTIRLINLPTTVTSLEAESFSNCTALSMFTVSQNITSYGEGILQNCTTLQSANVFSDNTKLPNNTFRNCSSLSKVTLSEKITSIGSNAFAGCISLSDVPFISQINEIDDFSFYNTGLVNLIVPDSLQSIPAYSFANCGNLVRVDIPKTVISIASTAFDGDENLTLGVWFDSYAHQFAKDNNIPYVLLDEFMLADVNIDGYININDVTAIQRNLAELEVFNDLQELAADANRDGFVDISDATTLQMFLAEYEIPYPIGEVITK